MEIIDTSKRCPFIASCYRAVTSLQLGLLRFGAFGLVIVLYALFGTPTPDQIGVIEGVIGALLLFALIHPELNALWKTPLPDAVNWVYAGRMALLFGMILPVLVGIMQGNQQGAALRDIVWLCFMVMPVFLIGIFPARQYKRFVALCVFAGVTLALREILRVLGAESAILGGAEATAYLGNSPLVLFSAIMLAGYGLAILIEHPRRFIFAFFLLTLSLIPIGAMVVGMQRASLGLFVFSLFILGFSGVRMRPFRALACLMVFGTIVAVFWQDISALGSVLMEKTAQVGFNRRAEEWLAVWNHISANPINVLLGTGWGGVYKSPAVGGMSVHFTHGALSFVLLKTGIAGLFVFGFYFYTLSRKIWNILMQASALRSLALGLALFCPFMIDVTLYASFKSFDYGVLLVLMAFAPRLIEGKEQQILVSGEKSL